MTRPDLRRMHRLLEQERQALVRADLAGLERIQPHKRALLERIEGAALTDSAGLGAVQLAARRNARLYEALMLGLRQARALLNGLRVAQADQTYGRDGARAPMDTARATLLRKA